jgi:hypothetical protein
MSYQQTVNEIRAAAEAVNPDGRFSHGRHVDLSQMFEGYYSMIYLYPFTINQSVDPEFIDSSTLLMGFFAQDKPDTSNEEREQIIADMDELSELFIEQLVLNKYAKITQLTKEPQYQQYQGTISGFAVRFNYQNFTPCP